MFNGTIAERTPAWATQVRLQTVFSDYDALISATISGVELMRSSAPHILGADNLGQALWNGPYCSVRAVPAEENLVNFDVVTGGTGLVIIEFTDALG